MKEQECDEPCGNRLIEYPKKLRRERGILKARHPVFDMSGAKPEEAVGICQKKRAQRVKPAEKDENKNRHQRKPFSCGHDKVKHEQNPDKRPNELEMDSRGNPECLADQRRRQPKGKIIDKCGGRIEIGRRLIEDYRPFVVDQRFKYAVPPSEIVVLIGISADSGKVEPDKCGGKYDADGHHVAARELGNPKPRRTAHREKQCDEHDENGGNGKVQPEPSGNKNQNGKR
mgnify:CR=1 FL=1